MALHPSVNLRLGYGAGQKGTTAIICNRTTSCSKLSGDGFTEDKNRSLQREKILSLKRAEKA